MRTKHFLATVMLIAALSAGCEGQNRAASTVAGTAGTASPNDPLPPKSGSATLSWQPPAERLDGSPLLNLAGYRILYGQESGRYSHAVEIENAGITRYFIADLTEGSWYFAVVAVDEEGLESPPSAEVSKHI